MAYIFEESAQRIRQELDERRALAAQELEQLSVETKDLKREIADISRSLQTAQKIMLREDLVCPRCFITNQDVALVVPVSSPDSIDRFRCRTCGDELAYDPMTGKEVTQ